MLPSKFPKSPKHHLDKRIPEIIMRAPKGGPDDLLCTKAVAEWLGVSTQLLEIGRSKGYGPAFVRISPRRIRYRREDVLAFLRQRTHTQTSQYDLKELKS